MATMMLMITQGGTGRPAAHSPSAEGMVDLAQK